jgi:hypothetical protein
MCRRTLADIARRSCNLIQLTLLQTNSDASTVAENMQLRTSGPATKLGHKRRWTHDATAPEVWRQYSFVTVLHWAKANVF